MAKIVVLDPGHGGTDPGAKGFGLQEKDLTLNMALAVGSVLSMDYEVRVEYTRKTDVYVGLKERADFANNLKADFFVSFHNNAFNTQAQGFESYVYTNASQASINAQSVIHKEIHGYLTTLGVGNRGMLKANFAVLRETNMPALLLENLFIDNQRDNDILKDKVDFLNIAEATARGIAKALSLPKKEAPKAEAPKAEPVTEPRQSQGLYRVQVGAFSKLENAQKLVNELKTKGIQAVILID